MIGEKLLRRLGIDAARLSAFCRTWRISEMALLKTGVAIEPAKSYMVSGWASVNEGTEGPPVYDVVSRYIERKKVIEVPEASNIRISGR